MRGAMSRAMSGAMGGTLYGTSGRADTRCHMHADISVNVDVVMAGGYAPALPDMGCPSLYV